MIKSPQRIILAAILLALVLFVGLHRVAQMMDQ